MRRVVFSIGSDFLGKWLPVCIAKAMPGIECRFIGKLWVDGLYARKAGYVYHHWPWIHSNSDLPASFPNLSDFHIQGLMPKDLSFKQRQTFSVIRTLIDHEFEDFAPDAVVYLTAESALGFQLDLAARLRGIPSIGLQTSFMRNALLVHAHGQAWVQFLLDQSIPNIASDTVIKCIEPINKSSPPKNCEKLKFQSMIWASRVERLMRTIIGAPSFDTIEGLIKMVRKPAWSQPGFFPDIGTSDISSVVPKGHVLVALHRPVLPGGRPDWLDLIRFALEATPENISLVLRPHPDEPGRPVPTEIVEALRSRGVRVSRPRRGADLEELIDHARLVITLTSAVGMQALRAGVPTVAIGPAFYAREGMAIAADPARPDLIKRMLIEHSLALPDSSHVMAFARWIEHGMMASMPELSTLLVPATELAHRIEATYLGAEVTQDSVLS